MDKRYVRYKGHKPHNHGEAIERYQFQPGESGRCRANKRAIETETGKIEWIVPEENKDKPIGMDLFRGKQYLHLPEKNIDPPKKPGRKKKFHLWEPGESGNPKGRPVGSVSILERLKAYLRRHPEDADSIARELVELGKTKNMNQLSAIKEIMDRIDGKVIEKHQIEGELPIKLLFVPAEQILSKKQQVELLPEGQNEKTE